MTVVQLLVDIVALYDTKDDFERAGQVDQELLKKALYAISSAARGNVDVQSSLQAIQTPYSSSHKLNNQQTNGNEEEDKVLRTEKAVGTDERVLKGGLFLDALYNISMQTNRTHYGKFIHTYLTANIIK